MKSKHVLLLFVGMLLVLTFVSCGGPEQKVQSKLETLIDAANDGDYDCARRYCMGTLRDLDLQNRFEMLVTFVGLSKMAVGEGLVESADEYVSEQMEKAYREGNVSMLKFFKTFKQEGEVEDLPGYGDTYKLVRGTCSDNSEHVLLVFAEYEDEWYPVCVFKKDINAEEIYKSLKSYPLSGKYEDKSVYDTDTELTAEFLYKYVVKNKI